MPGMHDSGSRAVKFIETMRNQRKYCLHPGDVYSDDGQRHHISSKQLADCYRVDINDCVVFNTLYEKFYEDLIHLHPLKMGNYVENRRELEKEFERRNRVVEKSTVRLLRE